MNDRKRIANQIDGLIRQKRISEEQLLHLMWLFSQEENVKITRNMTRRLLRLEKYSEKTIKKVTKFLSQVEACPSLSPEIKADSTRDLPSPEPELTTEYDATSDNQLELLREQDMKRRKVRKLQDRASSAPQEKKLPPIAPMELQEFQQNEYLTDADVLNSWLFVQTKYCKAAKKHGPGIAAPYGKATALPVSVRVISKKKKRRARKASQVRPSTSNAAQPSKRRAILVLPEVEDEDSSSSSSSEIIAKIKDEDVIVESEGGIYDYSENEGEGSEDDEVLLVDDEAEEEEDDEDSLGEDVIEGEELSEDLGESVCSSE